MKKEKKIAILLLTIFFISLGSTIYAYAVNSIMLDAAYVKQQKTNWCWAAAAENAVIYERTNKYTQKDAVAKIYGSAVNVSGSLADSKAAAEYISNYNEDYSYINGRNSYSALRNRINNKHCVMVAGGYYVNNVRNGGHMVLMFGYIDGTTPTSNGYIRYYDSEDGSRHLSYYDSFCNGSYNGRQYDQTVFNISK